MPFTFYLTDLDITQQLSEVATMAGEAAAILADTTISKNISLSDAKDVFKCIFPANTLSDAPTGIFAANDTFLSVFENPSTDDVLPFVSGLVQEMTGAPGASDILDNEAGVKADVAAKFESGITAMESGVIDNDTTKGDDACVSLFDQIKAADSTRFQLRSSVPETTGNITVLNYTNCLVTSQSSLETAGSGAKVTGFDYGTKALSIAGRDGGGSLYANGDILLFIHPDTGRGFTVTIDANQAGKLNGNSADTDTLTMTEIAEANLTNETTFSLFKKINSGSDTTDVTPPEVTPGVSLTLTIEHNGTSITDTTITTANVAGRSDFSDGDVIVAYTTGATPKAIVLTLNTITAAYLNNHLANASGVSMPLIADDKLDFKITIAAAGGQKDAGGETTITYTHSYALRGTLTA